MEILARGAIRNPERYRQPHDFSGLQFERGITPTDFDLVLDFGGREWVVGELKLQGTKVPEGQLRAITSALNSHTLAGVRSLGLVAVHNCQPDEVVDAAGCWVRDYWIAGRGWCQVPVSKPRRVREFIESWRNWQG